MHRSLLVILVLTSSVAAADPPPNILLILADDVGCETLGCYGGRSYRTPHLDRLAASGLKFRHCYSMPVCHPTRTCLLTGRYPRHLGHPRWGSFPKSEEERSLGTAMKQAGFATAIAGKWQLGLLSKDFEQPNRMGFDEYCLFGWHEGPRYYQPLLFQNGKQRTDVGDRFGPDVYCEFLIDFMTRHRDRRFFAFYSMALCHDVTDDLDKPVPFGPKGRYDSYREMIEAMDARVGRMVKALEDLGLRQKTLVLFTTDNGTSKRSYETVRDGKLIRRPVRSLVGNREIPGGKGNLSDDGTHVPLLASRPGSIRPKSVSDRLVDMSDFLPTLVELAAGKLPGKPAIDGRSFADVLAGKPGRGRNWAYSERGQRFWVRTRRWKLYDNGRLFDAAKDPAEKTVVALDAVPAGERAAVEMLRAAVREIDKHTPSSDRDE